MSAQPQIIDWVIEKELTLPTEEDLARIGDTEAHKTLLKKRRSDKADTADAGGSRVPGVVLPRTGTHEVEGRLFVASLAVNRDTPG